jgi:hypothetical protein
MAGGTSSGVAAETEKKGFPRWLLIVLAIVVLGGGFFALKMTVLKPKSETGVSTTASTSPTATSESTTQPKTPTAAAKPADAGSHSGTIVRAGLRGCGVNRSHVFIVALSEGEKELRLAGVDSFHYGPITQETDNRADAMMRGKRITVAEASESFFKIEGAATLADGRDMAEVLAAAGLVQQSDGASEAVIAACKEAQAAKRGIFGML